MKSCFKVFILLFLLAVFLAAFFAICEVLIAPISNVCFEQDCFSVEIARSAAEFEKGLMFRQSLPENSGMLFMFGAENIYPFWMKNTWIALDMIWIDNSSKVVFIKQNAQPCAIEECGNIIPDKKAKYVLEINGGLTEKLGIEVGDIATFQH